MIVENLRPDLPELISSCPCGSKPLMRIAIDRTGGGAVEVVLKYVWFIYCPEPGHTISVSSKEGYDDAVAKWEKFFGCRGNSSIGEMDDRL